MRSPTTWRPVQPNAAAGRRRRQAHHRLTRRPYGLDQRERRPSATGRAARQEAPRRRMTAAQLERIPITLVRRRSSQWNGAVEWALRPPKRHYPHGGVAGIAGIRSFIQASKRAWPGLVAGRRPATCTTPAATLGSTKASAASTARPGGSIRPFRDDVGGESSGAVRVVSGDHDTIADGGVAS
jgi:hypothetical protein